MKKIQKAGLSICFRDFPFSIQKFMLLFPFIISKYFTVDF